MNIKNCRFLRPFKINAIVLWPFVLYCEKKPSREIIAHEQVHLDQIKKDGPIKFYVKYLYEYVDGRRRGLDHYKAYRNISYEREAYGITKQHVQLD